MTVQLSYSHSPSAAVPGMLTDAFSPRTVRSKVARGLIKAGYGVFQVASVGSSGTSMLDPGEVFQIPNPGAAADVDAIAATVASAASVQTLDTEAEFDGVVGMDEMQPARKVTFICDASTDWDATNVTLVGINHLGQRVSETLAIATSTTATSTNFYRRVISVSIPAQTGAGGTATIGIAALASVVVGDFRGVAVRQPVKTSVATGGLYGYPGLTSTLVTANYVDAEQVPCLRAGGIWVFTEEAVVEGDPVYCRVASGAGGSHLGAFRNDADTASCVLIPGAYFARDAAAGVAWASFAY